MNAVPAIRIPARALLAIVIVQAFALIVRAYVQIRLQEAGVPEEPAKDLSYLVVPAILVAMLYPLLREHKRFLLDRFGTPRLTVRMLLCALAIGILLRLAWWNQLVARVAFGVTQNADPAAITGPSFAFACPAPQIAALGIGVMAILVPLMEETVHRGLIQSSLAHRGRAVAVLASAALFALFHPPANYLFVFVAGVVLGVLYWNARTLAAPLIAHTVYNLLAQLDSRCLRGHWNPTPEELPFLATGAVASILLIACAAAVAWLVSVKNVGAHEAPRT